MPFIRFIPALALIVSFTGPLAASAQTTPAPAAATSAAPSPHRGHRHHRPSLMHALRGLNLTDAQKQQVAAFRNQEKQADLNADPATRKANAMKMRDQVMGVLTTDQKTALAAEMHHSRMHGASAASPMPMASPGAQ